MKQFLHIFHNIVPPKVILIIRFKHESAKVARQRTWKMEKSLGNAKKEAKTYK